MIPTDLKEGLIHSFNVAYQRELPCNFTAEVAYVGNRGQDIIQRLDINASMTPGTNDAGRPHFAQFGRTASTTAFLPYKTTYNSLQVKVDRRFRNNFLVTNSYTLGRGESYDGGDSNGNISTPADIELSWGRTVNDRTPHLRQQLRLGPAVQQGRRRSAGWSTAGSSRACSPRRPAGARHHGERRAAARAGQHAAAEPDRRLGHHRRHRRRPALVRHVGVRAAGREHVRQRDAQRRRRRGPGLREPRRVAGQALRHRPRASPSSASTRSTSPTRCTPTTRTRRLGNAIFGQITGSYGERLVRFGLRFIF